MLVFNRAKCRRVDVLRLWKFEGFSGYNISCRIWGSLNSFHIIRRGIGSIGRLFFNMFESLTCQLYIKLLSYQHFINEKLLIMTYNFRKLFMLKSKIDG